MSSSFALEVLESRLLLSTDGPAFVGFPDPGLPTNMDVSDFVISGNGYQDWEGDAANGHDYYREVHAPQVFLLQKDLNGIWQEKSCVSVTVGSNTGKLEVEKDNTVTFTPDAQWQIQSNTNITVNYRVKHYNNDGTIASSQDFDSLLTIKLPQRIYVNVNPTNPDTTKPLGTSANPFRTIDAARLAVASLPRSNNPARDFADGPVEVLIAGGTYPQTAPITFVWNTTENDSGTLQTPVAFTSMNSSPVIVSGGG